MEAVSSAMDPASVGGRRMSDDREWYDDTDTGMDPESKDTGNAIAIGMSPSVGVGVALGVAMDNIAIGIAIDIALGAGLGAAWSSRD